MKKKIIITIILGTIITCIIYRLTYKDEMTFLTLGDSLSMGLTTYGVKGYSFNDYLKDYYEEKTILREYITEFSKENQTTTELLNMINNNEKLETTNTTIQESIANSKIITLSIGTDELNNLSKISNKNLQNYLKNMQKIIKQLRIFNKKEIIILGLYPTLKLNKEKVEEINNELKNYSKENNCHFIDIFPVSQNKEFIFTSQSIYLNYRAHKYISNLILQNIEN